MSTAITSPPSLLGSVDAVPCANFDVLPDGAVPPIGRLPPGPLTIRALSKGDATRVAKAVVLSPASTTGPFFLRTSVVAKILDDVDPEVARLVPCVVLDHARKPMDEDFSYLDVRAEWPLDRDASEAVWSDAENPHGAWLEKLLVARWGPGREPRMPMARIGESPNFIHASGALVAALEGATRKKLFGIRTPVGHITVRTPIAGGKSLPGTDAALARAAADAFWSVITGEGGDEGTVLESPHHAYWLGRLRGASPAPRAGACRSPLYAALWARFVDGAPRVDTRVAAARHSGAGLYYARYVDRSIHPVIRDGYFAHGKAPSEANLQYFIEQIAKAVEALGAAPP